MWILREYMSITTAGTEVCPNGLTGLYGEDSPVPANSTVTSSPNPAPKIPAATLRQKKIFQNADFRKCLVDPWCCTWGKGTCMC